MQKQDLLPLQVCMFSITTISTMNDVNELQFCLNLYIFFILLIKMTFMYIYMHIFKTILLLVSLF